ncbi:MAG: zinc ribbon domain-containing protein [Clostridia bacterium]|nr:zinc ribbon domain-containing protein [Clostridia bacterium]
MALIKCIECGKQISDKATTCPYCGCPISEMSTVGIVKIKLPQTEQISGGWVGLLSSKEASISSGDKILWRGKHGETATFSVNGVTPITVNLGAWGNLVKGFVSPRKKYELVQDYGFHWKATFRLSEVDVIDSH